MIIAEISKNQKEKIRVQVTEYKGTSFVDVRVYWENEEDEWLPSKKGISLNKDCIDEVIEALQKGSKALKA